MVLEQVVELLKGYGYLSIFLVSAIGNMIPYTTIPYLVLVMAYASTLTSPTQQVLVAVVSALGASIGKIVVYFIGRSAGRIINTNTRRRLEVFARLASKGIFVAIFLFAALPLPDDVIYLPVGMSGYSLAKYFIAVLSGKVIITLAAIYFGSSMRWLLEGGLGLPLWISLPVLIALTLWITLIILRMDWEKIVSDFNESFIKGTRTLIVELGRAILLVRK